MLTTKQVRSIMAKHGARDLYTNKTTGHKGNDRRVKCYYRGNDALVTALKAAAGADNVRVHGGSYSGAGVVVKCVLA